MLTMTSARDRQVVALENENEALRQKIATLEAELAEGRKVQVPSILRLTAKEQVILKLLYERSNVVSKSVFWNELYSHLPNGGPEPKIVDVFVCKMRKKMRPFGINIETVWGQGYRMTTDNKQRLDDLRKAAH